MLATALPIYRLFYSPFQNDISSQPTLVFTMSWYKHRVKHESFQFFLQLNKLKKTLKHVSTHPRRMFIYVDTFSKEEFGNIHNNFTELSCYSLYESFNMKPVHEFHSCKISFSTHIWSSKSPFPFTHAPEIHQSIHSFNNPDPHLFHIQQSFFFC